MNDNKTIVKRSFFRAPVSAKTRVTLVDESQTTNVKKCFDIKMLSDIGSTGDTAENHAFSQLVTLLSQIDEKLDRVLDALEKGEPGKRELEVRDTVDISGSGISLLLRENLSRGRLLHLSIIFTGSHRGKLDVLGRVARSDSVDDGKEILYQTGIEFVDLTESEKDLLVKYTFSQHRKQIRETGANSA